MVYVVTLVLVVAVLCSVTFVRARMVTGKGDFLVAGRSLTWPVLVFTLLSSWIGAGSLLGGAENAYRNGFSALWQAAGGWAGLIVISLVAGRARRFAQYTIPDLLETRFNSVARVLATTAIVISYTVITSYQFKGGGDILHLIFPQVGRDTGLYIIAGFVILFTASAGMASIAYLDLVIGSTVTLIVMVAVPILLIRAGGWGHVHQTLPPSHFQLFPASGPFKALDWFLPTMLLLVGNQGMYQKFFSAKTERDARVSVYGWIIGTVILETLLVTFAVVASSFLFTDKPREIIALAAKQGLPPMLGALLIGGVFAKVISTANNYLFSPATNLIHDVYERYIDRNASSRKILFVSRIIVVFLGLFAVLQATRFESVLQASLYAYTIYGAAVTPVVLAVFFWKRATAAGAVTSILLGTVVTIVWNLLQQFKPEFFPPSLRDFDAILPALVTSLASLIAVSFLSPVPDPERLRQLENA
jgi:solute:Na+ symporter, SSS family